LWSTKTSFAKEARMPDSVCPPKRMRYSFESRCRIVSLILAGESPQAAAVACGASRATGYRLWRRFQDGGWAALADRSSTPIRQPRRLLPEVEAEIVAARAHTQAGPLVLAAILERPASTIGKVLRRLGISRLPKPERDPVIRYERERAGELLHVDTKRLNRFWHVGKRILGDGRRRSTGAGWHFLHVAIDDHSRLAYAEVLASEDGETCAAFLLRALRWYRDQGIVVERVLTDNAGAYRSRPWRHVCARHRVPRRFTRPYRPADERQGRGADQNTPARVGLPLRLSHKPAPQPSPARLPQVVQPPSTTRLTRRPAADQSRLQCLWSLHLGRSSASVLSLGTFRASK
jgi:transposase InsO family protein